MVIRTFLDKNNTIINNSNINTARNRVTDLFYGGATGETQYSRYLLHFDESRLVSLYTGGTFTDLTKIKHTLRLTNSGFLDSDFFKESPIKQERACSFDLILFNVNQYWDEGTGYDYFPVPFIQGNCAISTNPSNWFYSETAIPWNNGPGVYSASPSSIIVATQHFDVGNENLEMDITHYVNGLMTGATNNGLGLAYAYSYELMSTRYTQHVGFFTKYTQTIYEPYIETIYSNYILDDRNNFFLDKPNKLYLYVNLAGNPTNLDSNPSVNVLDQNGNLFSAYTSTAVTHVTLGVYSIDIIVPTTQSITEDFIFNDVWDGISINGVSRPPITLDFALMDSFGYYNIGDNASLPKKVGVSVSGIHNQEKIKRGDIRKVIISTRIPYTVEQNQNISSLKYRLYVTEGKNEITITDFEQVEIASNYNYFLLDTQSLIPSTYYLDIQVQTNLEVLTLKEVINFDIVSESIFRNGQ